MINFAIFPARRSLPCATSSHCVLVVTGRSMTCGLPRTGFCSGGIPTLRSSPMDFMTVVQIAMSIRQFRGSKAAAYRMAWELRLHSADGQPRHKHFHLPHGLPLRRRACRRIRLPSLSDWRLEPSVTRPKKKGGSIALMLWSTCLLTGEPPGTCGRRPGRSCDRLLA